MIDELDSYAVDDFISFLPESYWRLFERQHEALWPVHLALLALGIAALVLAALGRQRSTSILLAIAIASSAITFHFQLYAELTPVGTLFGWAFLAQALLILIWGFTAKRQAPPWRSVPVWTGFSLAAFGLAIHPLLAPLTERNWTGAELFGMAPDPTIVTTLGILIILSRPLWLLLLLPISLTWCAVSGATVHSLDGPLALTMPALGIIAAAAASWKLFASHRTSHRPEQATNPQD